MINKKFKRGEECDIFRFMSVDMRIVSKDEEENKTRSF